MLFIPYGTDAPIYHWPFVTVAIIVLNILLYPLQMSLPDMPGNDAAIEYTIDDLQEMEGLSEQEQSSKLWQVFAGEERPGWHRFALSHGEGLHPIQWLTSFFMHAGILHLLGNMLFLWVFGIIIEGKVGPWLFALLYLSMGTIQNMIEQIIYLGLPMPPSLGASSAIYGLMVIAMIWAPRDNVLAIWLVLWLPVFVAIPVLIFAFLYLAFDFGILMIGGFQLSTAMLHVMGGLIGLIPALVFPGRSWVDCEQHDIFSLFREAAGKEPLSKKKTPRQKREAEQEQMEQEAAIKLKEDLFRKSIHAHLKVGNATAAERLMTNHRRRGGTTDWTRRQLVQLIHFYQVRQNWERVIDYSLRYLQRFEGQATTVRINLAKVYLLRMNYPRKALRELQLLKSGELSEQQQVTVQQITRRAKKLIDEGVIELGD